MQHVEPLIESEREAASSNGGSSGRMGSGGGTGDSGSGGSGGRTTGEGGTKEEESGRVSMFYNGHLLGVHFKDNLISSSELWTAICHD